MDNTATDELNKRLAFLMLEVVLEKDKESTITKSRQWDEEVIMDDIDYGVMKLVPLYLRKIKEIGHQTVYEKRLKVLYKYWWLKTIKNLDRLKEVVDALANHGKEVMLIKGVPVLNYYEENVLRPMADLDILVRKEAVFDAIRILEEMGWQSTDGAFLERLRKSPGLCMDFKHSIELEHPEEKSKMDLHWKVGNYASWELTAHVWDNAQPSKQLPVAKAPNLSDLLAMAVLHSVDSESKHHYNWIVDIAKMDPVLTDQVWKNARDLAKSELKQNWFDYGCAILHRFGVKTPIDPKVQQAPLGRLKKQEFGKKLNLPKYFWKKIENNLIILTINFPHDQGMKKIYRLFRRLAYFRLNRAL